MLRKLTIIFLLLAWSTVAQKPGYVPPPGGNVPKVGEKAPEFTLPDTSGKPVKLSELLAVPASERASGKSGAWVLLIFYRGYW